ncbi:MAG: DUF6541 family protein [Candidatus Binatia bacterium]
MTTIELYFRLAFATGVVLAPGWMLARALGVRGVAASLAWSLTLVFVVLGATFVLEASLTTTTALFAVAAIASFGAFLARWRERRMPALGPAPERWWVLGAGVVVGILLWRVAGQVQGDGLFHLARVRKLLELDQLSLDSVSEFADGGLHPGYAFPLWHGFLALVAQLAGTDPEQVVLHLPSILVPLAVVVAYEAGWALFRRSWAAAAAAGAHVALTCFAPGSGGAYTVLSLPETAARHLLVPAALVLALESMRAPSRALFASVAAAGFVLAVVHPTYAIFLWIPFAGFLVVRALWAKQDLGVGTAALAALAVPASLFMLWLLPVVGDTVSVSPDRGELQRAFTQYAGYLDVHSATSYNLAPEVFVRTGAIAIAAVLLFPLGAFAARRRWAAFVVGGSLAVLIVLLAPLLFTALADLVSISQARRAAGFFPFAFAFAGGLSVLSRLIGPFLPAIALIAGTTLQFVFPGDFNYVLDDAPPSWIVWLAVAGGATAIVVGTVRKGALLEAPAGFAAVLFLLPVIAVGLARWTPVDAPPGSTLSSGLVAALRTNTPEGAVVYSDQETSYRIAAFAPVYIAVAPPGHVADSKENRPYVRARDGRAFLATGDLSIPQRYGAEFLVVDRFRQRPGFDLPELYRDQRFVLYRLPPSS